MNNDLKELIIKVLVFSKHFLLQKKEVEIIIHQNLSIYELLISLLKGFNQGKYQVKKYYLKIKFFETWIPLFFAKDFFFILFQNIIENTQINFKISKNKKELIDDKSNRPNYVPIETNEIKCEICHKNGSDIKLIVGPLYGPFTKNKIYVHEMCALWMPGIYLDENNQFKNLKKEILRCNKIRCSECEEIGGGLGCYIKSCLNSYHYHCMLKECNYNNRSYIIFCPTHKDLMKKKYDEEEQLSCKICMSSLDEDKMVICYNCNFVFHIYCLDDQLSKVPEWDWFCQKCSEEIEQENAQENFPTKSKIKVNN